jgi:hypothetical protein
MKWNSLKTKMLASILGFTLVVYSLTCLLRVPGTWQTALMHCACQAIRTEPIIANY